MPRAPFQGHGHPRGHRERDQVRGGRPLDPGGGDGEQPGERRAEAAEGLSDPVVPRYVGEPAAPVRREAHHVQARDGGRRRGGRRIAAAAAAAAAARLSEALEAGFERRLELVAVAAGLDDPAERRKGLGGDRGRDQLRRRRRRSHAVCVVGAELATAGVCGEQEAGLFDEID